MGQWGGKYRVRRGQVRVLCVLPLSHWSTQSDQPVNLFAFGGFLLREHCSSLLRSPSGTCPLSSSQRNPEVPPQLLMWFKFSVLGS